MIAVCMAGRTGPNCEACPTDTFKASAGSADCSPCPSGTSTNGASGASACGEKPMQCNCEPQTFAVKITLHGHLIRSLLPCLSKFYQITKSVGKV